MKKKLSLVVLAICMAASVTACSGKEEAASTPVQEATSATESVPAQEATATTESEVSTNIGSALAGTNWMGNDMTIWSFEKDDSTLSLTYVEGEESIKAVGKYTLSAGDGGTTILTISVPDLELEFTAQLTTLNETTLSFTDSETGNTTSLDSYTEN
ncbi:MAG: hypothetical protein IJP31_10325 [Lachnospiraceae bacterium]|nr:hypothetical protein [Lachnospiraceae bacterium]